MKLTRMLSIMAVSALALGLSGLDSIHFQPDRKGPVISIEVKLGPLALDASPAVELTRLDEHSIRLVGGSGRLAIGLAPGEAIYGLTERIVDDIDASERRPEAVGGLDRRGETVEMWVRPTISGYAAFYLSSRGYGMFVEGSNPGVYDVGRSDPDLLQIDWYLRDEKFSCVFIEGSYLEILDRYTELTGRPFLPPRWVFLPWKWRDQAARNAFAELDLVKMNAEVVDDVVNYEKLELPIGVYMIDRPWAEGSNGYGNFNWDPRRFPNGDEMVKVLHDRGWRVVVWGAWALGKRDFEFGPEAKARGFIIGGRNLDYTNPAAAAWHRGKIEAFIRRSNVDGWKLDRGEEYNPSTETDVYFDGRNGVQVHNDYPRLYIQTYFEAARAARGQDFALMPRPSYTGSQQWGVKWGGDTRGCVARLIGPCQSTDKGLRSAIVSLQRMAMMGFPVWGSDTGGYQTFRSRDVFARWLEFSCFCPLMEIGGVDSHEPWNMPTRPRRDEEMIEIFHRYTWLHARLADYTHGLAVRAHETGNPIVHPLVFDWPEDPRAKDRVDEYMYGPALLRTPVWEEGRREREVYLPEGEWIYLWDGSKKFAGPVTIVQEAPLDVIPVYVQAGLKETLPPGLLEGL